MISLTLFGLSFVILATISYLSLQIKSVRTRNEVASICNAASDGVFEMGFWAALLFALKNVSTLWDEIPPYERVLDLLKQHKAKLGVSFYLVNFWSAARGVLVTDLDTAKEVFRSPTWLNRLQEGHYMYYGSFGKALGIVGGNNPSWGESRKAVMVAFRETNFLRPAHVEAVYVEEIQNVLENLRNECRSAEGRATFSPRHLFDLPLMNAFFRFIFGRRFDENHPIEGKLLDEMNYYNSSFSAGFGASDIIPFLRHFQILLPSGRGNKRASRMIYDIVALEVERRLKDKNESWSLDPQYLLDSLLKTHHDQDGSSQNHFTYENLLVTVRDLMLAGAETLIAALQHTILFMAAHQQTQQRIYDEIDNTIGHDRWPIYEDSKRMPYTQAGILETLRLGSVVPVSCRISHEDCTLGSLELKKGTYAVPAYIDIHRSEDLWEDPLVFRPERFIGQDGCIINTSKILPFSYGPRACPGELNGRVALFMITVILLREFKWELSDAHPPPSILKGTKGITRSPLPYYVKISPRNIKN